MITLAEYYAKSIKEGFEETSIEMQKTGIFLERLIKDILIPFQEETGYNLEDFKQKGTIVSSGHRTKERNEQIGGSPNSCHLSNLKYRAVDIFDPEQKLGKWARNKDKLDKNYFSIAKFSFENIAYTPTWFHIDDKPRTKGYGEFTPYLPLNK